MCTTVDHAPVDVMVVAVDLAVVVVYLEVLLELAKTAKLVRSTVVVSVMKKVVR